MTSTELLTSWDCSKRIFQHRLLAWITLHRIIAAGPDGTNLDKIGRAGGAPSSVTLDKWIEADLITKHVIPREKMSPTIRYKATPKALRLLRVTAETATPQAPTA